MRQRMIRLLIGALFVLALAISQLAGAGRAPIAHGAEPTPTPTQAQTSSEPGGHGGGGG